MIIAKKFAQTISLARHHFEVPSPLINHSLLLSFVQPALAKPFMNAPNILLMNSATGAKTSLELLGNQKLLVPSQNQI